MNNIQSYNLYFLSYLRKYEQYIHEFKIKFDFTLSVPY